jgi:hypothetical protein
LTRIPIEAPVLNIDIRHAKTWRLQRWLTEKRKALAGNARYGGGLARLMKEGLEQDIRLIRAELARRAAASRSADG